MLEINIESVCYIIEKAREFHGKDDTLMMPDDASNPSDDPNQAMLAQGNDIIYQEFKAAVDDLAPELQAEVVALMWIGRGDYTEDQWEAVLAEAQAHWTRQTAKYLITTPLVADYLAEGLGLFGYSCEE